MPTRIEFREAQMGLLFSFHAKNIRAATIQENFETNIRRNDLVLNQRNGRIDRVRFCIELQGLLLKLR